MLLVGPGTTVKALLDACPLLWEVLPGLDPAFAVLRDRGRGERWARAVRVADVARDMDRDWRALVASLADEVARRRGGPAPFGVTRSGDGRTPEGALVAALERLCEEVEAGCALDEAARRYEALVTEAAARATTEPDLWRALDAGREGPRPAALEERDATAWRPAGHPLAALAAEGVEVRRLCAALRAAVGRLGASPSRSRWRRERGAFAGLAEALRGVEARCRRLRQAWLPALAIHGAEQAARLLAERQDAALEALRRLRLAAAGDDPEYAARRAAEAAALLEDVTRLEEEVLAPLAARRLAEQDWVAVRELEDATGWFLIPRPPRWP